MSLNAVVSIQDEVMRLTELCEKIGEVRGIKGPRIDPSMFKHIVIARNCTLSGGSDQQLLLYGVPPNMDFVLTYINARIMDTTATSSPIISDELGILNTTAHTSTAATMYLKKNGTQITIQNVSYLNLANRPVLFVFSANDLIGLILSFGGIIAAGSTTVVPASFSGFLVPTGTGGIAERLTPMQTMIANSITVQQGPSSGGGNYNSNSTITVGNTPF